MNSAQINKEAMIVSAACGKKGTNVTRGVGGIPGSLDPENEIRRDRERAGGAPSCALKGPGERRGSALAAGGMAATAFPAATDAAVEILRGGAGNAVDAAVAAAWALAVCEPSGSGLGGKTTLLIRFADGQTKVIDGRSPAPAGVSGERLTPKQRKLGYRACTVPSTVAALGWAQRHYGALPFSRVMEPAIRLAEEGFGLTELHCRHLRWCEAALSANAAARRFFLKEGGRFRPGEVFRQPVLAATLKRLAEAGSDDFYLGQTARAIASDMASHDGLISAADLAACVRPIVCEAVAGLYRGHPILSAPPPAGGLQLLLGLSVLEHFPSGALGSEAADAYAALALVTQGVFRERGNRDIPPECATPSVARAMVSQERAGELYRRWTGTQEGSQGIRADMPQEEPPGETTHLCTADRYGNVVALTQSIQSLFGAKVANETLGFLYNDCLSTCSRDKRHGQLAGGALPRSNMAPTIVLGRGESQDSPKQAQPLLALGSAGSRRITSSLLHVITGFIDGRLSLADAISRARVHVTVLGRAHVEEPAASPQLQDFLGRRFASVRIHRRHSFYMGGVQAIHFDRDGSFVGMADPRRDGNAAGVEDCS